MTTTNKNSNNWTWRAYEIKSTVDIIRFIMFYHQISYKKHKN
jgi:hypothetical protein